MDVAELLTRSIPDLAISSGGPDLAFYGRDLWPRHLIEIQGGRLPEARPGAIVWPTSVAQVSTLVTLARREGFELVPFGAGSGVCGAVLPGARTVVVDMKRMASFRVERGPRVVAGAGALGITLEEELERRGYTMGHFPSSIICSTVGGWLAARSAGQCSGRYGKIEDMVVAAECVLGSGEVVRFRRRRSEPNLLPLLIGSEGTLGIITEAEIRLHPAPRARAFAAFSFPDIGASVTALRELFQSGLRPAVTRIYDPLDSLILRQGSVKEKGAPAQTGRLTRLRDDFWKALSKGALSAPAALHGAITAIESALVSKCTLILAFEGDAQSVAADAAQAHELCQRQRATSLGEGPARAWYEHRYSISYRQSPVYRSGAFLDTFEVAAPWSRIVDVYERVRTALGRHALVLAHLSHAYPDGCSIYFTFVGRGHKHQSSEQVYETAWRDALAAALEAGAVLSHHHGVGRSKAPYLGGELGFGRELVRRVMRAFDPARIMNPGALLGAEKDVDSISSRPAEPELGIDVESELATFDGQLTLGQAEQQLAPRGLTLALAFDADLALPLRSWLGRGFPWTKEPLDDPVRQQLAGFSARLGSDERLVVHPAPRRATGPDLSALFVGAGERLGKVEKMTLSVRRSEQRGSAVAPFEGECDPELSEGERSAWQRVVQSVSPRSSSAPPLGRSRP